MKVKRFSALDDQFMSREAFKTRVIARADELGVVVMIVTCVAVFICNTILVGFGMINFVQALAWFVVGVMASAGIGFSVTRLYYLIVAWRDL